MSENTSFGWAVGPSEYGPRGIIAHPEKSMAGNLVLQVGVENTDDAMGGWYKVAHVVLTPAEAAAFHAAIGEQIGACHAGDETALVTEVEAGTSPREARQPPSDRSPHHEHRPTTGSVTDRRGVVVVRGGQYPLFGTCRDCAHRIVAADGSAEWSDDPHALRRAWETP